MNPGSVLVTLTAVLSAPAPSQQAPDVKINTTRGLAVDTEIATTGSSVYVVWGRGVGSSATSYDICFDRSADRGATWQGTDVQLNSTQSGLGTAYHPKIAASGTWVYVVWEDSRSGSMDIYFNYSSDDGVTWQAQDRRIDTDPTGNGTSRLPRIAAWGSSVYVTWREDRNGANDDIYFNRSTDGGATWLGADLRLNTDVAGSAASWSQEISAIGPYVYVTWEDYRNGLADIYLNRSSDGGASWLGSDLRIDTDSPGNSYSLLPQIAVSLPSVYVTWTEVRNGESAIYLNSSADVGSTWQLSDRRIDTAPLGSARSMVSQVAALGNSVYVSWTDPRTRGSDIYFNYSSDRGSNWQTNDQRLNSIAHSGCTDHRIGVDGRLVAVTWEDSRNSPYGDVFINYSTDAGASWQNSDMRLPAGTPVVDSARHPAVSVSGSSVYVAWLDVRSSYIDVYFNMPFGLQRYGAGTAGSSGRLPQLDADGLATRGAPIQLRVSNGLGGAPGALLIGFGASSRVSIPFLGGPLLVLPTFVPSITLGGASGQAGVGSLVIPLAIPNDPRLVGANLNFQALLLDIGAPLGLSKTNAVQLWIG